MTVRIDPDWIEQLAGELHRVGRAIETTERELTTMVVQLLQEVEREYPEATVRAVVEEVRGLLRTVRTDAQGLATWYAQEARQLRTIVERYRQTEAEAMRLARRNISVISANRFAVGVPSSSGQVQNSMILSRISNQFQQIKG